MSGILQAAWIRRSLHFACLATVSSGLLGLFWADCLLASAQQPSPVQQKEEHPEFPLGQGRDTTLHLCTRCHSPTVILATGRDRDGWEAIITKMVSFGATGTDEEFSDIADYLTASFPPTTTEKVNINKATTAQITTALGISVDDAKSIITYRDKTGSFKTLEDLKKVPNIDTKNVDARKDRITF
jgi:competence protein ComEA